MKENFVNEEYQFSELSARIIEIFYLVYNKLGYGFLEKVYENALMFELKRNGLKAKAQHPIQVLYDGQVIGEYFADILVEDCILLELKASTKLVPEHEAQLLNYLKATNIEVGLLLNFGPKPEIKRKGYSNENK